MSRYIFKDPAKIASLQKVLTLKDNAKNNRCFSNKFWKKFVYVNLPLDILFIKSHKKNILKFCNCHQY